MATTTLDRRLVVLVLVALAALLVLPTLLLGVGMMGGPTMGGGTWGGGMWGGGMWGQGGSVPGWVAVAGVLTRLLFLAVLAGAGYLVYRAVAGSGATEDPALAELRMAYARGELDDEEYERRRERLEREG